MHKQKLILLQGIPASGKTTFREKLMSENPGTYDYVNRDEIREFMAAPHWSAEYEQKVLDVELLMAQNIVDFGKNLIVDDCNVSKKNVSLWWNFAYENDLEFKIERFYVPLNECIERDSSREKPIGVESITRLYNQFQELISDEE